jgi:DNA replication and repair protein RecF
LDIALSLKEGRRAYSLNDKKKNLQDIQGLVPAVVFVPDDLMLVKDSAGARRKLLDDIGKQLSATYSNILNDYQKTVRQRNTILKAQKSELMGAARAARTPLQESWDENLVSLGSLLFVHRIKLYKRLMDKATGIYRELSGHERLLSGYKPSFSRLGVDYNDEGLADMGKEEVEGLLYRELSAVYDEEWARGTTLVGPHRDEIVFFIDGRNARDFGSQGQQRGIALALKLAQLALVYEISGNQPLLLLDDVMSELDENRRAALIQAIQKTTQTVITATDLACFNEDLLKDAQIIDLNQPTDRTNDGEQV